MIHIIDDYYIDAVKSPPQFILKRRTISKPKDGGEPTERFLVEGFYSTVRGALKGLAKQVSTDVIADGLYSLPDALNRIEAKWGELCRVVDSNTKWED